MIDKNKTIATDFQEIPCKFIFKLVYSPQKHNMITDKIFWLNKSFPVSHIFLFIIFRLTWFVIPVSDTNLFTGILKLST